jgi:type I restriction enzyme M protein
MLDAETKRRIDACRDILVGKVPDPKSQVEQITIALIYKFMDDMDAEAEELGGKRTFFAGDYARYGWAKLMAPGLGGFDVLALYSEAIATMPENPGVPELFRDIFKNAYLPYRDPETLKSFLKEINYFSYDHSERLGDAFEYLLSVLGSQGDAGQFRTPRHIIDFMVEVMNPQKHESVLDPACGTAGFLISAWKHILKNNSSIRNADEGYSPISPKHIRPEPVEGLPGNLLTPDERARLAANIRGYDISPDMVRLSLVNLYLHGFSDPHVVEYDTLTQDDKWNEVADVILANPPFMSPKGGIKPHKRFSVQATRSEVLFVDYMAEHLTATGRAAIVVPEGIIFQSGTAYKALRKMLVDTSLVAVISLPAGVFNPYSGVKTSILILDKRVHKQTDSVLFVKVQNDGFNLGAQRRAVMNSDLPEATRLLRGWMTAPQAFEGDGVMAQAVARGRIGENGDFNLSGEMYVVGTTVTSSFEFVELGDVIDILDSRRRPITKQDRVPGPYPYYGATGELDRVHEFLFDEPLVLIGEDGAKWESGDKTAFAISGKTWVNNHAHVVRPQRDKLLDVFLIELLRQMDLSPHITGVTVPKLNQEKLRGIKIPLPPLKIQHQIVTEIEGYQKIIDGARQVLDNYKPHIAIDPAWPIVPLEDACEIQRGKFSHRPRNEPRFYGGDYPFIQTGDIVRAEGGKITYTQTLNEEGLSVSKMFHPPLVVITIAANIGDTAVLDFPSCFPDSVVALTPKAGVIAGFLELMMRLQKEHLNNIAPQAAQKNINIEILKTLKVPLPSLETQRAIVAEIEAEQALVNANRELVRRMEAKVKAAIDRVWGSANAG